MYLNEFLGEGESSFYKFSIVSKIQRNIIANISIRHYKHIRSDILNFNEFSRFLKATEDISSNIIIWNTVEIHFVLVNKYIIQNGKQNAVQNSLYRNISELCSA